MQRIAAHSGFTLIELLVTISIMALVMGGSIAAYLSFQTKQEVLTAAKNVQQLVRTAQGKARVRETPTSAACSGVNKLQGYRIKLSGGQIQIIALCGTSLSSFSEAVTVSTQSFPTGVAYSGSSPTDIDFYTLYRGVAVYPSGAFPATLEFTSSSDAALRYRFTLGSGGAISDLEAF
jgi:prepilin-type N-terminal cleavage/methylation domain-containing protein